MQYAARLPDLAQARGRLLRAVLRPSFAWGDGRVPSRWERARGATRVRSERARSVRGFSRKHAGSSAFHDREKRPKRPLATFATESDESRADREKGPHGYHRRR